MIKDNVMPERICLVERKRVGIESDYHIALSGGVVFRERYCGSWWDRNVLFKTEFYPTDEVLYARVDEDRALYTSPSWPVYYSRGDAELIASYIREHGVRPRYFSLPVEY